MAALGLKLRDAWEKTARREEYLPQLEAEARRSVYNGPLLALLGARQAQAQDPQAAANLIHALSAGEQSELIWRTLAAIYIDRGDRQRAANVLNEGRKSLHGFCPTLDAAQARMRALGPNAAQATVAEAICPEGPEALAAVYTPGSFWDGFSAWWGRRHPAQSGFATRQRWARDEPRNADAQRWWGLALLENRRFPEAAQTLARAVALAPNSGETHLALARTLEAGGRHSDAVVEYLQALERLPNSLPALLGLGHTSQEVGLRYARPAFLRATGIAPNAVEAWAGLARADAGRDEFLSECLGAFHAAVQIAPARTDFDVDYAVALNRSNRQEEAAARLYRRLSSSPEDASAHFYLGEILLKGKAMPAQLAEAEAQTRETLRLVPHNAMAESQLGEILLRQGKTEAAIRMLRLALADGPGEVAARRILARAYAKMGERGLAKAMAIQATTLFHAQQRLDVLMNQIDQRFADPGYHEDLLHLYRQTGQTTEALREHQTLSLLRTNPIAALKSYRDLRQLARSALGASAISSR